MKDIVFKTLTKTIPVDAGGQIEFYIVIDDTYGLCVTDTPTLYPSTATFDALKQYYKNIDFSDVEFIEVTVTKLPR